MKMIVLLTVMHDLLMTQLNFC